MRIKPTKLIEKYIGTIRELVNSRVSRYQSPTKKYANFSEYIKQKLGFSHPHEWDSLCACMDLVGDTNLAIENFVRFKIDGPTRYDDAGEKYLRLYGFLNATYLQQNAVVTLCEVFKISNLKSNQKKIYSLRIREIRHKLASHANSYGRSRREPIFLARVSLEGTKVTYSHGLGRRFDTLDLTTLLQEHLELMLEVLDLILEKAIEYVYRSNKRLRGTYVEKLNDLREEKRGNIVIRLPKGKKILIRGYIPSSWSYHEWFA